jgi:glycosyltransferase involved in cell wall biosynthesis
MIKVLHVIDSLDLGGAQTAMLNLVRFRDRAQLEMTVASMHGRGVFAGALEKEGVEVVSLSAAKWPPGYLLSLPRLLRRRRFDVGHFHLFGSNWIGKPIAALCGVRLRINHDQCNDRARTDRWWSLVLDRATNLLSSHIFAVSGSTRDCLVGGGIDPTKVSLLPNAVDTGRFRPAEAVGRTRARDELGVVPGRPVVVGMGRLHPQKNWPLFLQVAARFPEAEFVIAGTGPEEEKLRRLAPGNVRFAGFRDARTVLAAADVFLMTSDYEGTPMTLLEAMACGVPSVVSAVDGCAEIMGGGRGGGVTAAPGETDDFAGKVGELLAQPERRAREGAVARERALRDYDARAQTRAVEDVYTRLLATR